MESINISGLMRGTAGNEDDKSHVKALRYSLYNAATLIIAGAICGALVSVYFVLEAFIQPLVWAVLIGCVLFPIKRRLAWAGKMWLEEIKENGTPFSMGLILLPLKMVDSLAEQLWTQFFAHWKMLLAFLIVGGICFILSTIELLYPVTFVWNFGYFLYSVLGMFRAEWVWTCAVAYLIVALFFKEAFQSVCPRIHLSSIAVFIWISLIFHLSTWLGWLRLPVGVGLAVAFCVGSWNNLKVWMFPDEASMESAGEDGGGGGGESEGGEDQVILEDVEEENSGGAGGGGAAGAAVGGEPALGFGNPETIGTKTTEFPLASDRKGKTEKSRIGVHATRRRRATTPVPPPRRSRSFSIADGLGLIREMTPFADFMTRRHQRHDLLPGSDEVFANALNRLFLWLFFACVVVYVFNHPTILQLLPLPTLFILAKRGSLWVWRRYKPLSYVDEATAELIIPKPIYGLWSVVRIGDQKLLVLIESTISKVATVVLLCLLIIFTSLFCLIVFAQVQRESVQLVWTSANLINETVSRNPEIAKWLPQSDTMQSTVTSVIDKGYEHGREWLAKKVSGLITGNGQDDKNKLQVEKELLEVIDELYRSWHTNQSESPGGMVELCKLGLTSCPSAFGAAMAPVKTASTASAAAVEGRLDSATKTESESKTSQMWRFVDNMIKSEWVTTQLKDILDVNRMMEIMRDNLGSVVAILESLLLIIRANVNSVFNFLTAMISLLFGGGTVLLNFVVSTIVFLTALFYLLSISDKDYKPIGWMTAFSGSIVPTGEFEAAISSVLLATLKMAVFYGLYTWLTHTIFGANIVFIPAALAAVFAAVPFIGTYWAAAPAMIELWVLKGDLLRALLLLLAHLVPTYVIDMLIYGDIKDGGHPYLTGLAIVGGIYFLGLQGAIIGPILLCCLIVVFNVYRRILATESSSTESATTAASAVASDDDGLLQHRPLHHHHHHHNPLGNSSSQPPPPRGGRFFDQNRHLPNPRLCLHRSTPTDGSPLVLDPGGGSGAPGVERTPKSTPIVASPASTPNSVFQTGGNRTGGVLRTAAAVVLGGAGAGAGGARGGGGLSMARRLHRSNSLPNVEDDDDTVA